VTEIRLEGVTFDYPDGTRALEGVDLLIETGTSLALVGANGSGKTTLARIAALYEHPSRGTVDVLGERLGRTDVRALRERVSLVSSAMADMVRPALPAVDVVMSARHAALEPWWHTYTPADRDRARELLRENHVAHVADHPFGTLSSGERQRTLLARALMNDPGLVLLDEPSAGLDLGGREELVDRLDHLAGVPGAPPVVLVTHHVEEIPPSFTHLLVLREGRVIGCGPIGSTLDEGVLGRAFDLDVSLDRSGGRWTARRR
jgi:iron complex transport system ATP-binding protein